MRFIFSLLLSLSFAQAELPFRTDSDGPTNKKVERDGKPLEWFNLVEGQFPPEGSAHAISGELIQVDHLERAFYLRVDRNDSQDRGVWDLPLASVMLPYGSIYYLGAPAAIQDIPLGTHLQGLYYTRDANDKSPPPPTNYNRKTPESEFSRCFRLEDDFSLNARQKQLWKVDTIDLTTMKLTATLLDEGKSGGQPKIFDLLSSTRVLQGQGFADLKTLKPSQEVLLNLTWVTLYGPGRITDVWVDEKARALATAQQLERHRNHIRERGLAGWVTAVEDEAQNVTITFFGGVDAKLFDDLTLKDPNAPPPKDGSPPPTEPRGGLAVARESLMTFDPVNDRKTGSILEVKKIPVEPGSSGVQMKLKMDMMLEGYRPKRIVRCYPETWKVNALPREEQFFGRE